MKTKRHIFFLLLLFFCTFILLTESAPAVFVRMWGTYFCGTVNEHAFFDVRRIVFRDGFIYCTGVTTSDNLPVTPGAFQMLYGGGQDVYLCKFNTLGKLIWCTYYGSNGFDSDDDLLVDPNGFIYLFGFTSSTDLATPGAWQTVYGGGNSDCFLAKFDSSGNRLWCTFFGGEGEENNYGSPNWQYFGNSMTFDKNFKNLYILGHSTSDSGIATPEAFQKNRADSTIDCFIMKFDTSGKRIWGSYLGGNGDDLAESICYDSDDYLVCAGMTTSTDCFGDGGYQQTNAGGWDMFVTKIDTNCKKIMSTFYGGASTEWGFCDGIDNLGNLYLTGTTESERGFGTKGTSDTLNGGFDIFVSKFNSDLNRLWSTYIGSPVNDFTVCPAAFFGNKLFKLGETLSRTFPNNAGFMDLADDADNDNGFILKLDTSGTILWSYVFGGNASDIPGKLIIAPDSTIFVCGGTDSKDGIAENGFMNNNTTSWRSGFLIKFYELKITIDYQDGTSFCPGDSIFVPFSFSKKLDYDKTFEFELSDTTGNFTNPLILASIKTKSSGIASAKIPLDLPASVQYKMKIEGSDNTVALKIYAAPSAMITGENYVCPNYDLEYKTEPNPDFKNQWIVENGTITDSTQPASVKVRWTNPGLGKITLIQSSKSTGCSNSTSKIVNILFKDTYINGNNFICLSDNNQYYSTDTNGVYVKWQVSGSVILGSDSSDVVNVLWTGTQNDRVKVVKTARIGGCQDSVTMNVKVNLDSIPTPEISGDYAVCPNTEHIYDALTNNNSRYTFKWSCKNGTIIGEDTLSQVKVQWGVQAPSSISVTITNAFGCSTVGSEEISVNGSALSITGETLFCPYEPYVYSVKKFPGSELKWKTLRGTILGSDTTDTVTVVWTTFSFHSIKVVQTTLPDGCVDSVSYTVRKNVPSAKVKIPDLTEDVREQLNKTSKIPVILEDGKCLFGHDSTLTDSIIAVLRINKSLFLPKYSDNVKDSITGEWRIVTFQGKADTFAIGKPIISIEGYALLGDSVSTPIVLDTIIFMDYSLKPTLSNGNLTLLGISNSGGLRLIKSNNFNFINLYPNPTESNKINLVITGDSVISCRFLLFDCLGSEVQSSKLILNKGINNYEITLPEVLKTGIYSIIISSDDDTQSRNLIIIK